MHSVPEMKKTAASSSKQPAILSHEDLYEQLFQHILTSYKDAHESAMLDTPSTFQYHGDYDIWMDIVDPSVVSKLQELEGKSQPRLVVEYTHCQHKYQAKRVISCTGYEIEQRNMKTGTTRFIRRTPCPRTKQEKLQMEQAINARLLFGSRSVVDLPSDFVETMLTSITANFARDPQDPNKSCERSVISKSLSTLAQFFSSLGSQYKYVVDAGTKPSAQCVPGFVSHTDKTHDFNSVAFIKPTAIYNFLICARSRGYTCARVIIHGGSNAAYKGIQDDSLGFDMRYAGSANGQAYGVGYYFGLSDHSPVYYNKASSFADGSGILTLLLTSPRLGWNHDMQRKSGAYTTQKGLHGADQQVAKCYHTIKLRNNGSSDHDAVVVHDMPMMLPLGLVKAFDPQVGWLTKPF